MGILDILSPGSAKNPYAGMLSDEAWAYYQQMQRRQRVGGVLRGVGDYLSRGAVGDYRVRPTSGGGGQNDLMQMMQMQALLEKRQDRDAKRQRQKTKDEASAAVMSRIRGQGGPVGPETPVRGYPGAAPVSAQALPPKQPLSGLRSDPEFIANLMATSPKLATGLMFPKTKTPQYYKPQVVREGDKDVMKRYSKSGRYPPLDVKARPAARRDKDTRTAEQKNVPFFAEILGVSEKEALNIALERRKMSPDQFRQKVYLKALGGGMNTAEEARQITDQAMQMFYPQKYPAPEAPTPAPSSPGVLSQAYDYFKGAAKAAAPSGAEPAPRYPGMPRPTAGAAQQSYSAGETVTIGGKPYEVLGSNPDGTVTIMDLATGERHIAR